MNSRNSAKRIEERAKRSKELEQEMKGLKLRKGLSARPKGKTRRLLIEGTALFETDSYRVTRVIAASDESTRAAYEVDFVGGLASKLNGPYGAEVIAVPLTHCSLERPPEK